MENPMQHRKYFVGSITKLKPNEVFVFGSNLAGRHGAGAAWQASNLFGAEYGVAEGITGECYAIPTKDWNIQTLPLSAVEFYVKTFIEFARLNKHLTFIVTQIGCGLAGYAPKDIAPMFKNAPENCTFDIYWKPYLE